MNHPDSSNIYLFAYPRSGSNWFRYCFEFITKRPACSRETVWDTGIDGEELLFHLHEPGEYNMVASIDSRYPAILIVRNYKECMYSHMITAGYDAGFSQLNEIVQKHCNDYMTLINLYETVRDKESSMVVRYEEFVTDPRLVLESVIEYVLSLSPRLQGELPTATEMHQNLANLLHNLSYHRAQCLGGYRGKIPGTAHSGHALSSSPGMSNTSFYSERSNISDLKRVDTYVYNNMNIDIYNTYLKRYKEKE